MVSRRFFQIVANVRIMPLGLQTEAGEIVKTWEIRGN